MSDKEWLRKELSIIAIIVPVIYMLVAVYSFPLPMQKFAYWGVTTLLAELLIYSVYIFTLKNQDEGMTDAEIDY